MATKKNTSTTSAKMAYMTTLPAIGTTVSKPSIATPGVVQMPMIGQIDATKLTPQQKYDLAVKKYYSGAGNTLTVEEVALLNNPPTANVQPTTTATTTTQPTTATVPVGTSANANQLMDYTTAIADANAALAKAGVVNTLQVRKATAAGDMAIRGAERNIYYAQQNALNQLAQRGITGSPGLRTAAERAAIVAPSANKLQAINTMKENVTAANMLLAEEQAAAQKKNENAIATLTRATNISNQLGGKP